MVERTIRNRVLGHAYRATQVNLDAHKPIVTVAERQAANAAPVRAAVRGKRPNLLGGIMRCAVPVEVKPGGCRHIAAGHTAGVRPEPASINGRRLPSYVESLWRSGMAQESFVVQRDSAALQSVSAALSAAE